MNVKGQIANFHWVESPRDRLDVRDVLREIGSWLQGLAAVNVSWDSGRMQDVWRGAEPAQRKWESWLWESWERHGARANGEAN